MNKEYRVSVAIFAHPPDPVYYCAPLPTLTQKNMLYFESLFAPAEGSVNVRL